MGLDRIVGHEADGLARKLPKAVAAQGDRVERQVGRMAGDVFQRARKLAAGLAERADKDIEYDFVKPHSTSSGDHVHGIRGTRRVTKLPKVDPKRTVLGSISIADNNLSAGEVVTNNRIIDLGPLENAGYVQLASDPVDGVTKRVKDDHGGMPYVVYGKTKPIDLAAITSFVRDDLYGTTAGKCRGPRDLVNSNHGGDWAGWGWSQDDKFFSWEDSCDAVKRGLPRGKKLRTLSLDMCMTAGSSEAVVAACDRQIAEVLIGSADITNSGGFRESGILKACERNPHLSGLDIARQVIKDCAPKGINTRQRQVVATSLARRPMKAYTDAIRNLGDVMSAKAETSPELRNQLRAAFQASRAPFNEAGDEDFHNRDVHLLMQLIRHHVEDGPISQATRAVEAAHDGIVIAHQESGTERRATRGLTLFAKVGLDGDGKAHTFDMYGLDYRNTTFDQKTRWSRVLELINRDAVALEEGLAKMDAGNWTEAAAALRKAVAENPANLEAKRHLGTVLSKDSRTAGEAVGLLTGVIRHLNWGTAERTLAKRDLGLAYLSQGNNAKALIELGKMNENLTDFRATAQATKTYADYTDPDTGVEAWIKKEFGQALDVLAKLSPAA